MSERRIILLFQTAYKIIANRLLSFQSILLSRTSIQFDESNNRYSIKPEYELRVFKFAQMDRVRRNVPIDAQSVRSRFARVSLCLWTMSKLSTDMESTIDDHLNFHHHPVRARRHVYYEGN